MIKFSTELRLCVGVALFLALARFAPAAADTLRIGVADVPAVLDPILDRTQVADSLLPAMCDTLVALDADGRPVPALARTWTFAADAKTLTLELRDDAKFADGSPVDATAVKASLDRARGLPQSARRAELGAVAHVDAETPTRVRIDLDRAYSPLLARLAGRAGMIARAAGEDGDEAVCAGPYRFAERRPDGTLVLARDDAHWDRDAYPFAHVAFVPVGEAALRLARLRAGALDLAGAIAPGDAADLAGDRRIRVVRAIAPGWRAILFNLKRGRHDAAARTALERTFDRAALVRDAGVGPHEPGDRWTAPGSLFDTALPPRGEPSASSASHAFEMIVPARGEDIAVARMLAAQAQAAGIAIRLVVLGPAAAAQRVQNGDFEAALVAWRGGADPDDGAYAHFHCRGARNDSGICNPAVDAALDAARATPDIDARRIHYARATALLRADMPAIFLHHRATLVAQGVRLSDFVPAADGAWRVRGLRPRD
jgi:peptide/nickel transport system substrate-binding protein